MTMTSIPISRRAFLAATASLVGPIGVCLPDGRLKLEYMDQPPSLSDGWSIATPASQGISPPKLRIAYEQFYAEDQLVTARSLLVVRHGQLVAEGYCRDRNDLAQRRNIQSATKSITSLLLGIAAGQGQVLSVDQPLFEIVPDKFDSDSAKRTITLRHLLLMQSGIALDDGEFSNKVLRDEPADSLAFILQQPLARQPGTKWEYQDADTHLLGGALQRLVGTSLSEYAKVHLFEPLGITDYSWQMHRDGVNYGAVALYLRPRDMAKIGQMVLARGVWQGRSIIASEYLDRATSYQTDTAASEAYHFDYGYLWWLVRDLSAFTAYGHGGQYIFVVPSLDLVIVFTAEPSTNDDVFGITLQRFAPLARAVIQAVET
jgi:CubicO group peptidase (beta-lactamase class C family)